MATSDNQQGEQKPRRGTMLCNRRVDGPYTVLPNTIVQGSELTPKLTPNAFRVLAYIASLPEDWNLRIEQAATRCSLSRNLFYAAIKELEGCGYARHAVDHAPNGRIISRRWEFTLTRGQWSDEPHPEEGAEVHRTSYWTPGARKKRPKQPHPENRDEVGKASSRVASSGSASSGYEYTTKTIKHKAHKETKTNGGWPFPLIADVTVRVSDLGVDPEAVWAQYLTTSLASPPKNLPAYLVGIAKRMAKEEAAKRAGVDSPAASSMGAALNPEIAYAERNISVTASGKLTIGSEFRDELRQAFTDAQIDGALDCTMSAMGTNRNPAQIVAQIRRQCVYRKADAAKGRKPTKPFKPTRY